MLMPTPATPTSVHRALAIALRWSEWLPSCSLYCRRSFRHASALATLCEIHRLRCLTLFASSISWPSIRTARLDDPLATPHDFEQSLSHAVERRRCRMGRVKGVHRDRLAGKDPLHVTPPTPAPAR